MVPISIRQSPFVILNRLRKRTQDKTRENTHETAAEGQRCQVVDDRAEYKVGWRGTNCGYRIANHDTTQSCGRHTSASPPKDKNGSSN